MKFTNIISIIIVSITTLGRVYNVTDVFRVYVYVKMLTISCVIKFFVDLLSVMSQ